MEYLETVLLPEHKTALSPLLDDAPEERQAARAASRLGMAEWRMADLLRALIAGEDAWLGACALHLLGAIGTGELRGEVAALSTGRPGLLRETARWALAQAEGTA